MMPPRVFPTHMAAQLAELQQHTAFSSSPADKGQRNKHTRTNRKNLQQPIYIVILSIKSNKTKTPKLSSCILLLNLTTLAHRRVAIAANRKYIRRSSIPPCLPPRSQQTYCISHPTPPVLSPTRKHSGTQKNLARVHSILTGRREIFLLRLPKRI
jgi:hypothetical protein